MIPICVLENCNEETVGGSDYCEDHTIEQQLAARRPKPMGTLAQLIRGAKTKGYIQPISSGYQHA